MSGKVWFIGGEDVRFRIPLMIELRKRGFDMTAVGSEKGDAFLDHQFPYYRYALTRGIGPAADLRAAHQLRRLFQTHRPDIIHAFDTKPTIYAPLAARRAGVPARVRTITGMGHVFSSTSPVALALRPVYRALQRRASRASQVTIFQNAEDQKYFLDNAMVEPGCDALVRGSGIDVGRLLSERPSLEGLAKLRKDLDVDRHIVVTMIARLVTQKGVREFLEAARIVRSSMDNVVFLLVGPASTEGRKAVPVQEVLESRDVRYLGPRNDVPALLAISDMLVLPSYYREGVPRILLEGGAIGLPLITTNMPGCKDVVRDGWNGLLVPIKDARALAEAITRLLGSRDERVAMGARSRRLVLENFTLEAVSDAHTEIYESLLSTPPAPAESPLSPVSHRS